jgi:hypothetical protein
MEVKGMAQQRPALGRSAVEQEDASAHRQEGEPASGRAAPGIVIRHTAAVAPLEERAQASGRETTQPAKRRIVAVRDLQTERAGRVFPCLDAQRKYTGCIGYAQCSILCWASRPRERQAVVRVAQATGAPCRTCAYAREVYGDAAMLNGREVRLIECRLGFWHGRAPVSDFVQGKIPVNVGLPCPGYSETDAAHPAIERLRRAARLRKQER